ncbi:MAG: hypothetical protein MJ211_11120 [Bacteroidales bacterium]|nr:hypothetical protein [Bacteroidales bacterium]
MNSFLKKYNILSKHFLLLICSAITIFISSCSMDDEDITVKEDNNIGNIIKSQKIIVNIPQCVKDLNTKSKEYNNDTLFVYPTDTIIYTSIAKVINYSQKITNFVWETLDKTVSSKNNQEWISFEKPVYGAYTSDADSRPKQWQLDTNVIYNDCNWDFCLKIFDLPDTKQTDMFPALQFFYNKGFDKGSMIISPTDLDKVSFPEQQFGENMKCELDFNRNSENKLTNNIKIINLAYNYNNISIYYLHNITISLEEDTKNGFVTFMGLADLPYLWFSDINKKGFSLNFLGCGDINQNYLAIYSGLTSTTEESLRAKYDIIENSVGNILFNNYKSWCKMINRKDTTEYKAFENPGFFNNKGYIGCGNLSDNNALNCITKAQALIDKELPTSPYRNSIYQIEW